MIYDLRKFKFIFLLLFLSLISYLLGLKSVPSAIAQTMTNAFYILQMGNLNSIAGKPTGQTYKVSFTVGQTGANLFSGPNYKVRAGFQYIYSIIPFRFSISSVLVDFGIITPGTPVIRSQLLTVSNNSAYGYQVTVSQNHNLRVNASGNEIPPTTCDAGTCTTTTPAVWTSSLVYGFGYNCQNVSGTDCAAGYTDTTYYRPFIASPSAVSIMSSVNVGRNRKANVNYKVNIAQLQAAGLYTNIINYIATPTF
nr:hypothetical protein [Candidatus Levybacteria bacterium]